MSDDDRTVVDQALDLLVYAPLGFALEAKDMIPKLAERGRGQVALARVAGKFAAQRGQSEARRVVDGLIGGAGGRGSSTDRGDVHHPFEGYDELSAREIIFRLAEMSGQELEAVVAYEQHHRGRSTIINRVRQLQD